MTPTRFLLVVLFFFLLPISTSFSQSRTIEPANQHFFTLASEDSVHQVYRKVTTHPSDDVIFERFLDLENRIIRNETTRINPEEGYKEKITQEFDVFGNQLSLKITNQENGNFIKTYFYDGEQVGQVVKLSNTNYQIIRSGDSEPIGMESNDFEPQVNAKMDRWYKFLMNNSVFNSRFITKENQTAIVAVLVDAKGQLKAMELANSHELDEYFGNRVLEIIQKWGNNYKPAIDSFGNPVEKWLYIPIRYIKN